MNDLLDTEAVALLVNVKANTIRWYHKQGLMPPADRKFGRSLVWERNTIEQWNNNRKNHTEGVKHGQVTES